MHYNQKKFLPIFFSIILAAACSSAPIALNKLTGSQEIQSGEEAKIFWSFENAEFVRVDGFEQNFSAQDSLLTRPQINTKYRIVAYQDGDSSENFWSVRVFQPVQEEKTAFALPASVSLSSYLSGVKDFSAAQPARVKIIRHASLGNSDKNFSFRAIPLDENGNFLSGLANEKWSVKFSCGNDTISAAITQVAERQLTAENIPLNIGICLDRSAIAKKYFSEEISGVEEFSTALPAEDHISLTVYNQHIQTFPLRSRSDFSSAINTAKVTPAAGLNAMYKAAYASLNELRSMPLDPGVLVIVSVGSDNASIVYTPEDVIDAAQKANIPVYTIRLGDAAESFAMKYIASATGGKYYYLPDGSEDEISDIFQEIANSQRIFYEMQTSLPEAEKNCAEQKGWLTLSSANKKFSDNFVLPLEPQDNYTKYQALATFSYRDTVLGADYRTMLQSLAQTLQDNPTKNIELIGHSSIEGNDDANMIIALRRAQIIRRELLTMGAKAEQIRVRAEGNRKPIYYFQSEPWQEDYNRRVEIRWLDPALLPYEIIAGLVQTEDQAITDVLEWEKRGVKAYYETILYQKQPAFRIKLWGFATQSEAKNTARDLQRKYGGNLAVE